MKENKETISDGESAAEIRRRVHGAIISEQSETEDEKTLEKVRAEVIAKAKEYMLSIGKIVEMSENFIPKGEILDNIIAQAKKVEAMLSKKAKDLTRRGLSIRTEEIYYDHLERMYKENMPHCIEIIAAMKEIEERVIMIEQTLQDFIPEKGTLDIMNLIVDTEEALSEIKIPKVEEDIEENRNKVEKVKEMLNLLLVEYKAKMLEDIKGGIMTTPKAKRLSDMFFKASEENYSNINVLNSSFTSEERTAGGNMDPSKMLSEINSLLNRRGDDMIYSSLTRHRERICENIEKANKIEEVMEMLKEANEKINHGEEIGNLFTSAIDILNEVISKEEMSDLAPIVKLIQGADRILSTMSTGDEDETDTFFSEFIGNTLEKASKKLTVLLEKANEMAILPIHRFNKLEKEAT